MMNNTTVWYIGQRAEQLAYVYLSRRDDLVIAKQADDYGVDFLVSIVKDGQYTGRIFGVQVKAKLSLQPVQQEGEEATDSFRLDISDSPVPIDIPFPLCLFAFAMDKDEGYYKWIKKPTFSSEGRPELVLRQSNTFKKLTNAELDNIVAQVNLWYEKRNHTLDTA